METEQKSGEKSIGGLVIECSIETSVNNYHMYAYKRKPGGALVA